MGSREILQIAGIALGLLYLWLEYKASIWLWLIGAIMPAVHGTLYFTAGLYADCAMQAYYVAASLYGLAVWYGAARKTAREDEGSGKSVSNGGDEDSCETTRKEHRGGGISHTPLKTAVALVAVCAVVQAAIYLLLTNFTDSAVPFWDSLTTALSITAMWMLSRKYMEQWLVWLAADAVTVGLYIYKGIPMTAGLYALYTLLAAIGYLKWRREYLLARRTV